MPPPPPPLLSTVPSFVATTSISRVLFRSSLVLAGLCLQYLASVSVSAFLLVETYLREKDRECYLQNCLFYKIEREREAVCGLDSTVVFVVIDYDILKCNIAHRIALLGKTRHRAWLRVCVCGVALIMQHSTVGWIRFIYYPLESPLCSGTEQEIAQTEPVVFFCPWPADQRTCGCTVVACFSKLSVLVCFI